MARNPRAAVPGLAHHITQRGNDRQVVFRSDADRRVYLDLAQEYLHDAGVRLLAFCLMTNHVHFVAIPERGDSLSVWMRRLHGRYAQCFNARMLRTGHLWQSRFFSCALSPGHLSVALRYVEQNPVRASMVERPERYKWSSAAAHLSGAFGAILDRADWEVRGGAEGWRQLLESAPRQPIIHLLRRCNYGGRPFGGEEFIREIEARLGYSWKRWTYAQELKDHEIILGLEQLDPILVAVSGSS